MAKTVVLELPDGIAERIEKARHAPPPLSGTDRSAWIRAWIIDAIEMSLRQSEAAEHAAQNPQVYLTSFPWSAR